MTKLTACQKEQIEAYAEQGKSGSWISRYMGLKASGVNYRMLLAGFDPWPGKVNGNFKRRGSFSAEEEATLLRLAMTKSVYQIAKEMKRPYTSIRIKLMTLEVRAEKALEAACPPLTQPSGRNRWRRRKSTG